MRFVEGALGLSVSLCTLFASGGVAANANPLTPSIAHQPRLPVDRPHVVLTASGGLLILPNGLHASMGVPHPTLSSDDGSTFSSLTLLGQVLIQGEYQGIAVQIYRDEDPRYGRTTGFFLSLGRGRLLRSPKVRAAAQFHMYEEFLSNDSFHLRRDLSLAHIDTGRQLGDWGVVDMRFRATDTAATSCHGRTLTRSGVARGAMVFTPRHDNGFFGTLARARFNAAELSVSTCHQPFPGGGRSTACPTPYTIAEGDVFDGRRFRSFFASTAEFAPDTAFESAIAQEFWRKMSVLHEIDAMVPRSWIRDEADSVRWHGNAASFFSGAASVRATSAPFVDGPYPCDDGSVSAESFEGILTGDPGHPLTARFDTGPVLAPIEPDGWGGFIGRIVVTT